MTKSKARGISRRGVLRTGLAILATGSAARAATTQDLPVELKLAQASEKLDQSAVHYQQSPNAGAMCGTCINFEPPNACKIIAGNISANGWCVAFVPKSG